jgi:hypothetical protein
MWIFFLGRFIPCLGLVALCYQIKNRPWYVSTRWLTAGSTAAKPWSRVDTAVGVAAGGILLEPPIIHATREDNDHFMLLGPLHPPAYIPSRLTNSYTVDDLKNASPAEAP